MFEYSFWINYRRANIFFKSTLIYLADKRDLINMILEVNSDSENPDEIKFKMHDFPAE